MRSPYAGFRGFVSLGLLSASAGGLTACDGTTGGYPPPPPAYEAPAEAISAGKSPKFRPLIEALMAQRKAAANLASAPKGDGAKAQELFAKSREASGKVGEAVAAANLNEDEMKQWNAITALDDAKLAELVK